MAETFLLDIVTPSKKLLSREVEELTAPGQEGEFGVLRDHIPFLTVLKPGVLSFKKGSEAGQFAVGRGYAEVLPDKTTVLVDYAEAASGINIEEAKAALVRTDEALKNLSVEDPEYHVTLEANELAQAQIMVKERQKG